ncbi:MAG: ABC transporter permease [Acidobacteriia bacterium]|nr:ABC transporter permease [Terriglobia bacterium]
MKWKIITALLWKEWRETRWKWAVLLFSLHIPILFFWGALKGPWMSFRGANYFLFREIVDSHFAGQAGFILTGGLFLVAFFASAISVPELESRRMFLLFERPVQRSHLLLLKFCAGGFETIIALGLSLLITISFAYAAVLLLSDDVTWSLSWRPYFHLLGEAFRATLITGGAGLVVFSFTFLLSVVFEKWWVTVAASWIALALFFKFTGYRLLEWVLRFVEVERKFGHWKDLSLEQRKVASAAWAMEQPNLLVKPLPLLALLLVSVAFYLATLYFFKRKEMK